MKKFRTVLSIAFLAIAGLTLSWNSGGHQQIADIAWSKLNHNAKVAIAKILLAGDTAVEHSRDGTDRTVSFVPSPPDGGDFSEAYLEKEVRPKFRLASTWADVIKGGTSGQYEALITDLNASSPGVHPEKGGEDTRLKSWHYTDLPLFSDNPSAHAPRGSDARRALGMAWKNLSEQEASGNPDRKQEAFWLYLFCHIEEDVHQPLHCVSNYSVDPVEGDAGGNKFEVQAPGYTDPTKMSTTRLHGYWDSGIDHAKRADSEKGFEETTADWLGKVKLTDQEVAVDDPAAWVRNGADLATTQVYGSLKQGDTLTNAYNTQQNELCRHQAVLAGTRLANRLNSLLGKG